MTTLELLQSRQSPATLTAPAPTEEQLRDILLAATAVPDHGKLRPYRFAVIGESGKARFGEALAQVVDAARGGISPELQEKFRKRAYLAPTQIVVIYSPKSDEKIPHWEQLVSASCTGYAMILAATATGLGAHWRSSSVLEGDAITQLFSLTPGERLLGWVNIGQVGVRPVAARADVDWDAVVSRL
jgi:nitroreductase